MRRVSIVGNSGSGKTTLGRALAARLGVPFVELDSLVHQPGWVERPTPELRDELDRLLPPEGAWVVDGNYRARVGDIVRPRADTVVWLDYARWVQTSRVVRRTLRRTVKREELWNGNRERWSNLYSRDPYKSIIAWTWTQHGNYRAQFEAEMDDAENAHLTYVRLRSPREATRWLAGVGPAGSRGPSGFRSPDRRG